MNILNSLRHKILCLRLFNLYIKFYAVTHWVGPALLYSFTAAASWTFSGACAGDTPLYCAGATESQVDCKNWYLPAAPEEGLIAWISPPDSRWAICCKWPFTFTEEPLVDCLGWFVVVFAGACCVWAWVWLTCWVCVDFGVCCVWASFA